jgi:hypothetical protein
MGMPEWHLHAENNWRKELILLTEKVFTEKVNVLLLGIVARWCWVQGGKPWIVYGKKALEQLVAWGGAVTRGLGKKTHGNISAGYKSACIYYCVKMYVRVMRPENDYSLNNSL